MDFLCVVLCMVAAYLLYMCWHFRLFHKQGIPTNGLPIPLLGNMGKLIRGGMTEGNNGDLEKYGETHGTFMGRKPILTTIDPDIIKEAFIKQHVVFTERFNFRSGDPVDDAMISNIVDHGYWKSIRSILTPAFSSGKLKSMLRQMNECAGIYAGYLVKESAGGKSLEMKEFAGAYTMDVIASIGFGLDVNTREDRNNPFVQNAMKAITIRISHPLNLINIFCPFLKPFVTPLKLSFIDHQAKEFFVSIANQALDSRKSEADSGRVDFLQLMANAESEEGGHKMTRTEIIAQALVFFIAGYETTATALSFLAYNLACNPEKQEQLIEEVCRVVGDKEHVDDDDLHNMPYLDMCVSESLRLFPPVGRTDRLPSEDVQVKGIHVPKGCFVMVPIHQMHRYAKIYPDPEEYIPERFSPEEKAKRNPLHYMPFGTGPRQCIGSRLALMEVKVAICHVLRSHRFVPVVETQRPPKISKKSALLNMENGNWLGLEKHEQN